MSRYSGTYATLAVPSFVLEAIWEEIRNIGGPCGDDYIRDHMQEGQHELAVRFGDICLIPYGEPKPSLEHEILEWAQKLWGVKTWEKLGNKLAEECGEVNGAIWARSLSTEQ